MALKFKIGQPVSQIIKPIQGVVTEQRVIADEIQFHVQYVNAAGQLSAVWLSEDALEAMDVQAPPTATLVQSIAAGMKVNEDADARASKKE